MKKVLAFATLLCVSIVTYAQTLEEHRSIDRNGNNGVVTYFFQHTEVQGTQFLKDSWANAKVVTELGYVFNNVSLKFDAFNNKFVFNRHDTAFELTPDAATIYVSEGSADPAKTAVFKKGFAINGKINRNKYVQVLAEGKTGLLKYVAKDIEEYNEYGNASKLQRYKDMEQYYILDNNQFTSVNLNRKNLETALQPKWAQVDAFLKQNGLSGKDEKSWVAAVNYYNTL